jgi:6-pyruvoyltetrahydropterin/6-carboxytetrahydropterin synthase
MDTYIEIDGWRNNIRFSSAHVIPEYERCGRLHGHTYAIHARIWGERDEGGIVVDFSVVKNLLREIAKELDHMVLIPSKFKGIKADKDIEVESEGKRYVFPKEDCIFLPLDSTSAENLASYILDKVIERLPMDRLKEVEIGVDEGFGQGARVKRKIE